MACYYHVEIGSKLLFKLTRYFQFIIFHILLLKTPESVISCVVGGMLLCGLMYLLTRLWTSQDRSYVIGRKWICAIKWISAVSEAELFRIFLLRGTHWNSMGTLVIWLWARWRRSVTLLLFSIYFYLTGNKFCFHKIHFFIDSLQQRTQQRQHSDTHAWHKDNDCLTVDSHKLKEQTTAAFYIKTPAFQPWLAFLSGQCLCQGGDLWSPRPYQTQTNPHWHRIGALITLWQSVTLMRTFMFPAKCTHPLSPSFKDNSVSHNFVLISIVLTFISISNNNIEFTGWDLVTAWAH